MNARALLHQVNLDTSLNKYSGNKQATLNTPVTNALTGNTNFDNPFDELNNNSNTIDLAKSNAQMLLNQNRFKYMHDEAIANTAIQRRVADLLKAGLNPYLANQILGGGGFAGELPQNAAQAASGENKQKLDWKTFMAQSGMNILQSIIGATMSGFAIYQTQKALMAAKDDHAKSIEELNGKWHKSNSEWNKNMENGARGLADGLSEMTDQMPNIIASLFGRWNWNF